MSAKTKRKVHRIAVPPDGLSYFPDFLSETEETEIIETLANLNFDDVLFQGFLAKRKMKKYGYGYEFKQPEANLEEPFPDWLMMLRDRAAHLAGLEPEDVEQSLVAWYPPGAGIGWHRDAPAFGPTVMGISFASNDLMRFRREADGGIELYKQPVARRSLYVMTGPARSVWQHSLAPAKALRYSITFRTVRSQYRASTK